MTGHTVHILLCVCVCIHIHTNTHVCRGSFLQLMWRNPIPLAKIPTPSSIFSSIASLLFSFALFIISPLHCLAQRDSCGRHYAKLCVPLWQRKTKKKERELEDGGGRVGECDLEQESVWHSGSRRPTELLPTCFCSQHLHLIGKQPL